MSLDIHPVILAGGRGTRFWPLSRRGRPKPFLSPDGGPTLLERAWRRATALADPGQVFVAVSEPLAEAVRHALPELPQKNLVCEPESKDTGPAAVPWHENGENSVRYSRSRTSSPRPTRTAPPSMG